VGPLRETLNSVRAQRWDAIEHIAIDGGSTDGTVDLLSARNDEIALWRSERDLGIYDAMNKGLAESRGDYVLFLNSGDVLQGRVLYPGMEVGRLLPVRALNFWGRPRWLRMKDVRLGMPYCHQGILFRNESLAPYDTSLRLSADYEFLLANLAQAGLGAPSNHGTGFVQFDITGVSNTRVLERDLEASRVILRRFGWYHWLRFWSRQGPKLVVRRLVAVWRGRGAVCKRAQSNNDA
jgi:glycosyltransferase involved in cell wall biosynthesis